MQDLNSLTKLGRKLVNLGENCDKIKKHKESSLPQIKDSEKHEHQVKFPQLNYTQHFIVWIKNF